MIKEEFAWRIQGLQVFGRYLSFCKRILEPVGWMASRISVRGSPTSEGPETRAFLAGGALVTVSISSISPVFCVFGRVEPHHERSGSLFPSFGCLGERSESLVDAPHDCEKGLKRTQSKGRLSA
ncbi:hypothetical protein QQP08_011835 [Theobroma cacao]|nr:hypothetical protein QQP08_011835 [Theobroma cacao]